MDSIALKDADVCLWSDYKLENDENEYSSWFEIQTMFMLIDDSMKWSDPSNDF